MKELEDRILKEGKVLPGDILKVDSFLNHQVDSQLATRIGEEFHRLFHEKPINKILTIEASGIIYAMPAAQAFGNVPVLIARKTAVGTMSEEKYSAEAFSYTKKTPYTIAVSKDYLSEEDHVLLVDDFLANGEAMCALIKLCHEAGAVIEGCGIVIEKHYQAGRKRIEAEGVEVTSLACIESMGEDGIRFAEK